MRTTTYQGCGHFWVRGLLRWDNYDEILESWYYVVNQQEDEMPKRGNVEAYYGGRRLADITYQTPLVPDSPIPTIRLQLVLWAVACSLCGAVGFIWAWLMFGVAQ